MTDDPSPRSTPAPSVPPGVAPPREFRPSFRHQFVETLVGAPVLGAVVALGLRYLSGVDSTTFLIAAGVASALAFTGLYLVRFRISAPRRVRVDEGGLTVDGPKGTVTLRWDAVVRARHRAHNGLRWEFFANDEDERPSFLLRDDGLSITDWDALSTAIQRALESRDVPIRMDAFGSAFRDE